MVEQHQVEILKHLLAFFEAGCSISGSDDGAVHIDGPCGSHHLGYGGSKEQASYIKQIIDPPPPYPTGPQPAPVVPEYDIYPPAWLLDLLSHTPRH